ncbi:hypothetical protein AMTRI_Chr05g60780 [Amborella trichopoda]
MGLTGSPSDRDRWYKSFLPDTVTASESDSRMLYASSEVIDVESMMTKEGFLHAYPDELLALQTTHSPRFLGLSPKHGIWPNTRFGKGTIIGVLDTGIWPEHPSLNDIGMSQPPKKWKGWCVDAGPDFNSSHCNKKLIGAQVFTKGALAAKANVSDSPRDDEGHGTHTATTAAGQFCTALLAHLAIYKVCYNNMACYASDILACFDKAILDGVDNFTGDIIAIGAFEAVQKGILVSCAATNDGPDEGTVRSTAPWVLTVGASTMDRELWADTKLGNGQIFTGQSLFQPKDFKPTLFPLVHLFSDPKCNGNLSTTALSGKVLLCEDGCGMVLETYFSFLKGGGTAMIITNPEDDPLQTLLAADILPVSNVNFYDGNKIRAYLNSTKNPKAGVVFMGSVFEKTAAPMGSTFTSRGPNIVSPGILKPDIIGPGVNIVAGWPSNLSPTGIEDPRRVVFNVKIGTSMSTPHLSSIGALLKAAHPDWTPAAKKSALMTTADILDNKGKPIKEHDMIWPMSLPWVQRIHCSNKTIITEGDLNYPSFSVVFSPSGPSSFTFKRTGTNVEQVESFYVVEVVEPVGVSVEVKPTKLSFTKANEKQEYTVTFLLKENGPSSHSQGHIIWHSGSKYHVRSPIAIVLSKDLNL